MRFKVALLALALCGVSAAPHAPAAGTAVAQSIQPMWVDPRHERRDHGDDRGGNRVRPVRDIIETVRQRYGGGPMGGPRLEQDGGRAFYVLNWRFPNEVVEEIRVDAESGQIYR